MHIEPGPVDGTKTALGCATAAVAGATAIYPVIRTARENGLALLAGRSLNATVGGVLFFAVPPHFPVGVGEVRFILGSALFLVLGAGPAVPDLAMGHLILGMFLSPPELAQ